MPKIYKRMVSQMRARGMSVKQAHATATSVGQKFGLFKKGTRELTTKGKRRNAMTASQRAKSRAAKYSGNSPKSYSYSSRTNRARLKKV